MGAGEVRDVGWIGAFAKEGVCVGPFGIDFDPCRREVYVEKAGAFLEDRPDDQGCGEEVPADLKVDDWLALYQPATRRR